MVRAHTRCLLSFKADSILKLWVFEIRLKLNCFKKLAYYYLMFLQGDSLSLHLCIYIYVYVYIINIISIFCYLHVVYRATVLHKELGYWFQIIYYVLSMWVPLPAAQWYAVDPAAIAGGYRFKFIY